MTFGGALRKVIGASLLCLALQCTGAQATGSISLDSSSFLKSASERGNSSTKFFRHLVSLRKLTQHALRSTYSWVPVQAWNRQWTDKALYKKYELTTEEIDYVESVIRPMEFSGASDDE